MAGFGGDQHDPLGRLVQVAGGRSELVEGALGFTLLLRGFGNPLVDNGRVAAGLQRRPVAGKLALAVGQDMLG